MSNSYNKALKSYLKNKSDRTYYYENGSVYAEAWFKDSKLHRDNDKPADICYYNDRPAYIDYREGGSVWSESWYKNGVQYTPQKEDG